MKIEKAMIFLALAMIAAGLYLIHIPSCLIGVGLLIWIDQYIPDREKGKHK